MRLLSTIQSELDIRRGGFNPHGVLRFASLPKSWTEAPAELRLADSESFRVSECNSWLASQISALSELAAAPDKDAEGYRHGVIRQLQRFSTAIDKRIQNQWELEKVGHLYDSQPTEGWPCIYHTGPLLLANITVLNTDVSLLPREPFHEKRPPGTVCPRGIVLGSGDALHRLRESTRLRVLARNHQGRSFWCFRVLKRIAQLYRGPI